MNELANSIKEFGVFQPIIVKKSIKGYEIIAGERRVKASKIAGLTTIPAIIEDFSDDEMMQKVIRYFIFNSRRISTKIRKE